MAEAYEVNVAPHNFYGPLHDDERAFLRRGTQFPHHGDRYRQRRLARRILHRSAGDREWRALVPDKPGWGIEVNEKAVRARPPRVAHRGIEAGSVQGEAGVARFKVVTPIGASFTVAGGGYGTMEALTRIDAEIVERRRHRGGIHRRRARRRRHLCQGHDDHQAHDRRAPEEPRHRARQRRRRLRRCRRRHRARHPRDQLPGHLHRGSGGPCHGLLLAGHRRIIEQDRMVRTGRWAEAARRC